MSKRPDPYDELFRAHGHTLEKACLTILKWRLAQLRDHAALLSDKGWRTDDPIKLSALDYMAGQIAELHAAYQAVAALTKQANPKHIGIGTTVGL